jgi:hypothetical protein
MIEQSKISTQMPNRCNGDDMTFILSQKIPGDLSGVVVSEEECSLPCGRLHSLKVPLADLPQARTRAFMG